MPRTLRFPPYPRREHKGSGQARVKIDGRHVYLGVFGSPASYTRYQQLMAQWTAAQDVRANTPAPPLNKAAINLTVADVVASFLLWAEKNYSARGRELHNFRLAVKPLLELFGTDLASSLDALCLERLRDSFPGRGWNQTTSNRRLSRIKTLWKWAERNQLVPRGSAAHLATVRGLAINKPGVRGKRTRRHPTEDEVNKVALAMSVRAGTALQVQWLTGMRTSEVLMMRAGDIDRSGDVWLYTPGMHKNDWRGQERVVPLSLRCQALLRPLLGEEPGEWLFRPLYKNGRPKPGVRYDTHTFGQAVRRGIAAAKVQPFECYDLRHGAKMRFTREFGVDVARSLLGQKSIESVAHYGCLDLESAVDAARKMA